MTLSKFYKNGSREEHVHWLKRLKIPSPFFRDYCRLFHPLHINEHTGLLTNKSQLPKNNFHGMLMIIFELRFLVFPYHWRCFLLFLVNFINMFMLVWTLPKTVLTNFVCSIPSKMLQTSVMLVLIAKRINIAKRISKSMKLKSYQSQNWPFFSTISSLLILKVQYSVLV